MKDYFILSRTNILDLNDIVLHWIKKGWKPLGGVTAGEGQFYQVMIMDNV